MTRRLMATHAAAAVGLAIAMACAGSPTSPSSTGGGSGPGASGATVTITSSGVSPSSVTVNVGQSVTFVNNDSRPHEIASDPHPTHGSCPEIERGLGTIAAGQTKLTNAFSQAKTCSYHDHLNSETASLMGTITIR